MITRIVFIVLFSLVVCHLQLLNRQQISAKIGTSLLYAAQTKVMYGSTIRIKALGSNYQ
jgi:hypothetical protein